MDRTDRHPCARCGIVRTVRPDRKTSTLCRDCQDVTGDLGERDVWLDPAAA